MRYSLNQIQSMMLALIPTDYKTEIAEDMDLVELGCIEMAAALGKELFFETESTEKTVDGETVIIETKYVSEDLTISEAYLASYFAYRDYLLRLKDELNRDAINFKTLTFEIKSLEKRPEAINDTLYQVNRYLNNYINQAKGSTAILGKTKKFGAKR